MNRLKYQNAAGQIKVRKINQKRPINRGNYLRCAWNDGPATLKGILMRNMYVLTGTRQR